MRGSRGALVELLGELERDPLVAAGVDQQQRAPGEQPGGVAEVVLAEPGGEVAAGALRRPELERVVAQPAGQLLLAGRADRDHAVDRDPSRRRRGSP